MNKEKIKKYIIAECKNLLKFSPDILEIDVFVEDFNYGGRETGLLVELYDKKRKRRICKNSILHENDYKQYINGFLGQVLVYLHKKKLIYFTCELKRI